jgi:phosphate transport system substrate-binding protein
MMMHRLVAAACVLALAAATTFAALPAAAETGGTPQTLWIRGAGATFPAPLYAKWIEAYHAEHPSVSLTYDAVGSGEGISRFVAGSVDFGASDAVLTDAQAAKVTSGVITIPATAGMVVLAYNLPGVSGALKLPRDVYTGIFAGTVKRWDDPRIAAANPGMALPRRDIVIVARQDGSGTTAAFTSHLAAVSPSWHEQGLGVGTLIDWPGSAMLARGNEGVASRIKISEGAIGYVEYGFAKRLGIPVAALQNKAGRFVAPSESAGQRALAQASAATADDPRMTILDPSGTEAYPIVTYSWLLLYRQYADARTSAAIKDFVGWGLTRGQSFASGLDYLPLPAEIASRGRQALADVGY